MKNKIAMIDAFLASMRKMKNMKIGKIPLLLSALLLVSSFAIVLSVQSSNAYPTSAGPVLTKIRVSPSTATLNVGETQIFNAIALDQNGAPMANINITWTSSNMAVGIVAPRNAITNVNGIASTIFKARAVGTAMVNATNGAVKGSATVMVSKNRSKTITVEAGKSVNLTGIKCMGPIGVAVIGSNGSSGTIVCGNIKVNATVTAVDPTGMGAADKGAAGPAAKADGYCLIRADKTLDTVGVCRWVDP